MTASWGSNALSFVERHGLWSKEQQEAASRLRKIVEEKKLEVIRLSFPDQHGILRGKTLVASEAMASLESGCSITTTMLAKDTSHKTVFPVFTAGGGFGMKEMEGAADVLMVADPTTFRVLPWAPTTGWLLCDLYFSDGRPVPFATRHLYRKVLDQLGQRGYDFVAGLEVEFHLFKLEDAHMAPEDAGQPGRPPSVSLLSHGYQYLTEQRYDQMEPALEIIRRDVLALGLPLAVGRGRVRPEPVRIHLCADQGAYARRQHGAVSLGREADRAPPRLSRDLHVPAETAERVRVRLAPASIDRVARRAARMRSWPRISGEALSPFGRAYLAGLLEHARASTVFTTPTINGYKRYRSYSLAPDRAIWGRDNRGVMIRVLGGPGDSATRLENRIGEPAANPYLYMASQILSGLDGVDRKLDPGPSADTPYETKAALLPKSLREAVFALQRRSVLPAGAGRGVRGLLRSHQERGDRAVSGRGVGLGAPRIFRDVLRSALSRRPCERRDP